MAQIYDSSHSGQEIDAAVDAVQTTIPSQLAQIGSNLDNLTTQVTSNTANIARLQLSLPTMTSEDGFYICDGNGYVAFSVTPTNGVKYIGQISYKSLE